MPFSEVDESNAQFLGAWKMLAHGAPHGEVAEFSGVAAAFSREPVQFFNALGFTRPIEGRLDLEARLSAMIQYARSAQCAYFAALCEPWVPDPLLPHLDEIAREYGLVHFMDWTGMAADELTPPTRQARDLRIRPVEDTETRVAVNDLNSAAYGMPAEPGRDTFARETMWNRIYGSVGFRDNTPVATASTMIVDSRLYVAMVATHPDYQRRGYAEACMRDSLRRATDATGLRRTILHATDAGRPVYAKMGYQDVCRFRLYTEETH